ncbi:SusC/RagA family TonB-linked outer membrane protein [Tamlana sp. I1]|uniref:SusC/RagA family TonB-linked outer membrane protein n=1 Tax=Tamlana sp. I1 TaxID=2762061 RepID=UPI00188E452E|nr:TonB-dependent receptor [Tamlana sp. I1]
MKTKFYLKKTALLFLLLLGFVFTTTAQQSNDISGSVLDTNGQSLPGATILEKGTMNGAQTDFDGKFNLTVSNPNATLEVSYVGYFTKTVQLNGKKTINITLEEDIAKLDEVVVIAYGTQKKGNVSGSLTSVGSEALEGRPVADFQNSLQGQVAGLTITKNNGAPGGSTSVVIRGKGSISGGSTPLYVIDGNIMNNGIGNQGAGFTNPDPLSTINPSDIESITVLKDASAASIYGARGANGVILITTKRGKAGKARLEFNTYAGFQSAWNTLDLLNSNQYQEVWNNARDNTGQNRIPALDGTTLTTNTNWQREVLRTAPISNYEFRASGGGEKTVYSTSVGYMNQEGIIIGTGLKRYNVTANTDSELGKFKFATSLNVSRTLYDKESIGNEATILNNAISMAPNVPVYDSNNTGGFAGPTLQDGEPAMNPVAAQTLVDNVNKVNRILGSVFATYEIIDGLTYKISTGFDFITFHDRYTVPEFNLNQNQIPGFEQGALVREYFGENNSILLENTLNYKRAFGKHNIDALAGYTVQETHYSDSNTRALGGFTGTGLPVISGRDPDIAPQVSGIISETRTTSIIGRLIYDYDNRYLLTANFRRDGSSKFVGDNQYDNFYSGSVGWNIGNEAFLEDTFISDLKLRASYGSLGNDAINANAARFTLNKSATYVLGTSQGLATGVGPAGIMQNADLRWEKQTQLDVGLDFGIFANKFTMTVDYFEKTSNDLLLPITVPGHTGFSTLTINAGEIVNKGLEVSGVYHGAIGNDFTFNIGGNFTTLDNKVTKLANDLEFIESDGFSQLSNAQRVRMEPGHSVRSFYGYKTDGIFQTQADIDAAPFQSDLTAPGDFKYVDKNDDGVINEEDRDFIGDAIPDITYGLNISMGYKNWDFSAQFQGVSGNDIWSETKFFTQAYARTNNLSTAVLDAWTPTNPSNTMPRQAPRTLTDNYRISDFFIEDGSYFRLKNIQLGYAFSDFVRAKLGDLSRLRIYLAAQNLFTISDYADVGFDPEMGSSGIDNVVYPQARTMTIGLQVGF